MAKPSNNTQKQERAQARKRKHAKTQKQHQTKKRMMQNAPDNRDTIGLVYAEWCGHCQALKPEWADMKAQINNDPKMKNQCKIIEIESAGAEPKIASINKKVKDGKPLSVDGYPTIFKFKKQSGTVTKYEGGRKAQEMVAWIKGGNAGQEQVPSGLYGGKRRRKTQKSRA